MVELEKMFGVPVIESYGMTEASHQMASNPLPPRPRKPGSVGLAAGTGGGDPRRGREGCCRAGEVGEVVHPRAQRHPRLRGESRGERQGLHADGWFRTGDQGVLDEEGYLRLTGRLKELINRGGEKISPLEVDEVLIDAPGGGPGGHLRHAARQARRGGGGRGGAARGSDGDRARAARLLREPRLADFKVPRKVVLLAEIPKGATGKLQRIGLAAEAGPRVVT